MLLMLSYLEGRSTIDSGRFVHLDPTLFGDLCRHPFLLAFSLAALHLMVYTQLGKLTQLGVYPFVDGV